MNTSSTVVPTGGDTMTESTKTVTDLATKYWWVLVLLAVLVYFWHTTRKNKTKETKHETTDESA